MKPPRTGYHRPSSSQMALPLDDERAEAETETSRILFCTDCAGYKRHVYHHAPALYRCGCGKIRKYVAPNAGEKAG